MLIKELNIEHFGKFQQKKIVFQDGVNLVYGDNEDGKSTVHSFIKGMLFGIDKPRGRETKEDLYSRYQPWDTKSLYSGALDINLGDNSYRIYRNFYKETRELKVHNLSTGKELPVEVGQPLEILGGLNKTNYSNTISIQQLKVGPDKTLAMEVQNYIANISATKNNEVDLSKAYLSLTNSKKEILSNKTEQSLYEIQEKIQNSQREEEQLVAMFEELHKLEEQEEKEDQREKYWNYMSILEEMKQQDRILDSLKEKERERTKETIQAREESPNEKEKVENKYVLEVGVILGLVLLCVGIFIHNERLEVTSSIILIGMVVAILLLKKKRWKTEQIIEKSLEKKNAQKEDVLPLKELQLQINYLIKTRRELNDNALRLKSEITAYRSRTCDISGVKQETMNELYDEMEYPKQVVEKNNLLLQKEKENKRLAIEKLKWEISQKEELIDIAEEYKSTFKQLKVLLEGESEKIAAIELAIKTIDKISVEIHESFGKALNDAISKIVLQETNGAYSKVYLDEQFNIRMEQNHHIVSLESLSVGTIHQVYFALRLAVTDLLFPGTELPIILDEPFAFYDEKRLFATLDMILQRKKQIIIFTCHTREKELMDEMGINYNFITL